MHGVTGSGITDRGISEDAPFVIMRTRRLRFAHGNEVFAATDQTIVHPGNLPHCAIHAVFPLVTFKTVNQIAFGPLLRLRGTDETTVHTQFLPCRAGRNGLQKRHQSDSASSVLFLELFANLHRHSVLLNLAVTIVHHPHFAFAAFLQRCIERGQELATVSSRIDGYFWNNRFGFLCRLLRNNGVRRGNNCVRIDYTLLLFWEGLWVGFFPLQHFG